MTEVYLKPNPASEFDVAGMGSALLDFTVKIGDDVVGALKLTKAGMQLVDAARSGEILSYLKKNSYLIETSPGGSAANTLAGIANFGGRAVLFGRVGQDAQGDLYMAETEKAGVKANLGRDSSATGHAITFITPDGERSFATHLGAALSLTKSDLDPLIISKSKIIHVEGYLFEPPNLREACFFAIKTAKESGVLVSIDLSDPGLIRRIHGVFGEALKAGTDIIFANEDEARAFTGFEDEKACGALSGLCSFAAVKLGERGSIIRTGGKTYRIPARKTEVANTNGAGDMYASGVLFGIARGYSPEECGRLGSYAASLVVAQAGARISGRIDPKAMIFS